MPPSKSIDGPSKFSLVFEVSPSLSIDGSSEDGDFEMTDVAFDTPSWPPGILGKTYGFSLGF